MTTEEMERGGRVSNYLQFTDEELSLAIKTTRLALAFLIGRGAFFGLATSKLASELTQLECFWENRKRK